MLFAENEIVKNNSNILKPIFYIESQVTAIEFYKSIGYVLTDGIQFLSDGLMHIRMHKEIKI
jgi:predicted GNAT family N-acyltransferase